MNNVYLNNAGNYLLDTVFSILIGIFVFRFLIQLMDADYHNPICQFIVKMTTPILAPLNAFIPKTDNVNLASLLVAFVLSCLKLYLLLSTSLNILSFSGIFVLALSNLLGLILTILFWLLIIMVIFSWINPNINQPVVRLIYQLTTPLLIPAQRLVPPIGGIDFSPIIVFILITLTRMLLVEPLTDYGFRLL